MGGGGDNWQNNILNVRGVNNRVKRLIIRGYLANWKPEIVCLQESKLEQCSDETIHNL